MSKLLESRQFTFLVFCLMMFGVNVLCYGVPPSLTFEGFLIPGLKRSITSIPAWSVFGLVLSQIVIMIRKKIRPESNQRFNIWQKMTFGLFIGLFANAFFKIPW
jgi:hypothetical protein